MVSKGAVHPPSPSTIRGKSASIALDPKGERIAYCNGRGIFIRSLDDSSPTLAYFGHVKETSAVAWSPSGFYIASGDVTGTVRVWDAVGEDQVLKLELKPFAGRINAIAWDGESKRIIAVGEGKERSGHAFSVDTGSSVGEIIGHSKPINGIAIKSERPFRAVTVSDDSTAVLLSNVPYKYTLSLQKHTGFVNCVAYSSEEGGKYFATASSDRTVLLFDGKSGELIGPFDGPDRHTGGIFGIAFSPSGQELATCSADGTVKFYSVPERRVIDTREIKTKLGSAVGNQQVALAWVRPDQIVSLSLSGEINLISRSPNATEVNALYGHQRGITALACDAKGRLFSGSYDGQMYTFDPAGICAPLGGSHHTNQIVGIVSDSKGTTRSIGMDDTLRELDNTGTGFSSNTSATSGQPKGIAAGKDGSIFVLTASTVTHITSNSKADLSLDYTATALAAHPESGLLAVGADDGKVYIYDAGGHIQPQLKHTLINNRSAISALAFDPAGSLIAAGDASGKILVYKAPDFALAISQWVFHTARVQSIAFSANGKHAVSGSLDTNVIVWSVEKPMRNTQIKSAHPGGVNGVVWRDTTTIVSAGSDAALRTFTLTL
ncbi:uncharacterized protein L969DRAFT_68069 [Mixia osmundae IAM 14324]|uniref:Uncharacterized protein n=1 Tax=Mixia osmundae (strain CBS 9802 / IAM 14324 / JCM 22182 / KY 12970) TaxID=764103 RepID=G7E4D0_MIXOS|nr:uncharacterized protein L969DRAFT_68069 [Mixia osmundae IAM 14324]KEI36293.1 hypothetical protein L969DRAFT_68069 [Mixia osmundae IAM 14324]GAA97690.1 hypothetical protein E5Q_04368 [Mixia osmundae IAM 14324]